MFKRKSKLLAVLLTFVIVAGALSGCSSKNTAKSPVQEMRQQRMS